jgi:undecaprenyl-diphosphatase
LKKKHTARDQSPALDAPPRKTIIILIAGFIASVAGLLAFSEIAEHVVSGATQAFDDAVRAAVHAQSSPAATPFMRLFTFLGSTPFISICTIAIFAMFWRSGRKHRAVLFAITIIGATLLMLVLKYSFHRPRPEPFFNTPLPPFDSFPSGHSMVSFCFYTALAALTAANEDRKKKRILIWGCCLGLVTMIGLSRIYLGVHWPTDVICAYLAATVWVCAVAFAYHVWKHKKAQ